MENEKKAWNDKINKRIKELEGERSIAEGQIAQNTTDYVRESERLAHNRDTRDSLATERGKIIQVSGRHQIRKSLHTELSYSRICSLEKRCEWKFAY